MAEIRSIEAFSDYLDHEMAWRIKEVSVMTSLISANKNRKDNTYIRASVPLLYAHWEGFVKNAAVNYIRFLSTKRLKYSELKKCFIVVGMKEELLKIIETN